MRWKRTLQLLDVHCEGEIGRVVTGGAPKIPGNTVAEQLHWMNTDPKGEALRRFLTLEPRGTPMGSVNLLLPPKHPDAHAAFVILQPDQAARKPEIDIGITLWKIAPKATRLCIPA